MSTLKDLVANGKRVHFEMYRKGELHYKTDDGFHIRKHENSLKIF